MPPTQTTISRLRRGPLPAVTAYAEGYAAGHSAAAKELATEHIIETWAQWLYDAGYPFDVKTYARPHSQFPPVQLPPPLPVLDKLADIYAARDGLMAPSWQALRLEVGIE